MVTTLAPCWYCCGLIRQFGIGTVVVGESVNFRGGIDWLQENGIKVIDLASKECVRDAWQIHRGESGPVARRHRRGMNSAPFDRDSHEAKE